jgi:hypothetical protein
VRDRATLDFIRDRVLADIAANPSIRPYLGEDAPRVGHRPRREACDLGHPIVTRNGRRQCVECDRARSRARREGRR